MLFLLFCLHCSQNLDPTSQEEPREDLTSELIILAEIESNPQNAHELCEKLKSETNRKRCQSISMRPHLWTEVNSLPVTKRLAEGPTGALLTPRVKAQSIPSIGTESACQPQDTSCFEAEAKKANTVEDAINACQQIPEKKWQQECFFVTAEEWLEKPNSEAYHEATQLCLLTDTFQPHCFQHLSKKLAEDVPKATEVDQEKYRKIIQHGKQIKQSWDSRDAIFGKAMVDLMWAKALDISYVRAGIVAGNPFDHLPPAAIPHIRAAAVYHLMYMEGASSFDLEGWALRTQRALNARLKPADTRTPRAFSREKINQNWSSDKNDDNTIPAVFYMTDGRRAVSRDSHLDLLLCTLEAAARLPNGKTLLKQGMAHQSNLVRWTANRLLNQR